MAVTDLRVRDHLLSASLSRRHADGQPADPVVFEDAEQFTVVQPARARLGDRPDGVTVDRPTTPD